MRRLIEKYDKKVTAVLLNFNGYSDTINCIKSLYNLNYEKLNIIVVDNASTDNSVQYIKSAFPNIRIITNKKNLGYSKGFNIGIKEALVLGSDFILVLNNDTLLNPELLNELVKTALSDHNIGAVFGKVLFYGTNKLQSVGKSFNSYLLNSKLIGFGEVDTGQYDKVQQYDFADDVCLLISREALESIGGYDPDLFLYYEEVDLFVRLNKAKFKLYYNPNAIIWHKVSQSSGGGWNPIKSYHLSRSKIICLRKNLNDFRFSIALLLISFTEIPKQMLNWFLKGKFELSNATFRGFISGIKWVIGKN